MLKIFYVNNSFIIGESIQKQKKFQHNVVSMDEIIEVEYPFFIMRMSDEKKGQSLIFHSIPSNPNRIYLRKSSICFEFLPSEEIKKYYAEVLSKVKAEKAGIVIPEEKIPEIH